MIIIILHALIARILATHVPLDEVDNLGTVVDRLVDRSSVHAIRASLLHDTASGPSFAQTLTDVDLDAAIIGKTGSPTIRGDPSMRPRPCHQRLMRKMVATGCHMTENPIGRQVISARRHHRLIQAMSAAKVSASVDLFATLQQEQAPVKADDDLKLLMNSLRGASLNDDDTAAAGLQMRLVDVQDGEDELPSRYNATALKAYFSKRPLVVLKRSLQISGALSSFALQLALDKLHGRSSQAAIQTQRAADLRDVLMSLGPFFIKFGQALSIRPDILSPEAMAEMQQLCDKVPHFDSKIAMQTMATELGASPEEIFSELSPEPVAAASLGQVYKGRLRKTGEAVAVKVQRPFVLGSMSLDLYLIREFAQALRLTGQINPNRTDLVAHVDEFGSRLYEELDYRVECQNGIRIAKHMASLPKVVIPRCYPEYTSRLVHTAQWIEGEKLAQSTADEVRNDLVNVGIIAYLTQLLGEGFFHADPHPGNLIRTPDGRLAIIDFGLMTELPEDHKFAVIEAIVHLVNRDYDEVGEDFKKLDFIPKFADTKPMVPALTNVFNAALTNVKQIDFNDLTADLTQLTFEHPFRIPPYFALVIRAIGVLEGIALAGNPDFAFIDKAYPYISQRLLKGDNPRLRNALRYMIYGRDGVFDAERLIHMLSAFERNEAVVRNGAGTLSYDDDNQIHPATNDEAERVSTALAFLFSPEGKFFREFLLKEAVSSIDVLSRSTLMHMPELLPEPASTTLKMARALVPEAVRALIPEVTADEEKALRSTRALLDFFLKQDGLGPGTAGPSGTHALQESMTHAAQTAQRLQPVLQLHSGEMQSFGIQIAARLAELYLARAARQVL